MPPGPPPINTLDLRRALVAQAMSRQNPIAYPSNISDPRVQPQGALPSGGPNTPGVPVPTTPQPPTPPVVNAAQPQGGANPAQVLAQVGQGAQGPGFDQDTRNIAKALVMKLMKHI
jgi:hypothetical protein